MKYFCNIEVVIKNVVDKEEASNKILSLFHSKEWHELAQKYNLISSETYVSEPEELC